MEKGVEKYHIKVGKYHIKAVNEVVDLEVEDNAKKAWWQ